MNFRMVSWLLGTLTLVIGISMVFSLLWAYGNGEEAARRGILASMGISLALGLVLVIVGRGAMRQNLLLRESLGVVALGWIVAATLGALPYLLSGALTSPADAFFESMSGFTTTGSSVITDIESLPDSILFWRSFTHWLGGIGIVVLFIAILPQMGVGARHLFRSEIPGVSKEGISPRIKDTAVYLLAIYVTLTVTESTALMAAGMTLRDALCHTFGTVASGGFSTRNASVGAYESLAIEIIITCFMILAGVNFSLYFLLFRGPRRGRVFRDHELRTYVSVFAVAAVLIAVDLAASGSVPRITDAVRNAVFNVASILTTTGFAIGNFDQWPSFSKLLLVTLMFIGGSAGSTAGGMKVIRVIVLAKYAYIAVYRWFRPHAVRSIRISRRSLKDETVDAVLGYFVLFMLIYGVVTLLMALMGLDPVTAATSVIATMGNIGPGLADVGPARNFAAIPPAGKFVLATCMLLGRLEIYTLMALFVPAFWKR